MVTLIKQLFPILIRPYLLMSSLLFMYLLIIPCTIMSQKDTPKETTTLSPISIKYGSDPKSGKEKGYG